MLKTIIVLSDGTEIASGVGVIPNIRKCKISFYGDDVKLCAKSGYQNKSDRRGWGELQKRNRLCNL